MKKGEPSMDKGIQADILSDLQSGKITDVSKTENGIVLTIDMSEYNHNPYNILRCELINCKEFLLKLQSDVFIENLHEFKKYEIEMEGAEFRNSKLVVHCRDPKENKASILIETETIKVYDELNNEISPMNLYILNGVCNGIDFHIRDGIKKSSYTGKSVKFDENVLNYLQSKEQYWARYEQKGPEKAFDLLIGLDEYGVKLFSVPEIKQLIIICEGFND